MYVAMLGLIISLCGLGDEATDSCDRLTSAATPLTWCFGALAAGLTLATVAWPASRPLRHALWSAPPIMMLTVVAIATL